MYAEPKLEKLEYLFEKLSGEDFFKEVVYHSRFHHGISKLTEKKLLIMDEILTTLLQVLKAAGASKKETNDADT